MRKSYDLPQDDGSRRSRCPPSHHEMALTPHYAQASTRAPRPSPLSTQPPVSPGKVSPHHQQGSTMPSAAPAASPSHHLVSFASMGGEVPTRGRTIARMGQWHPCLLPQRRQSHHQARPILSCRLGLLPPTLYQRWGGAPPRRHAMLCLAVCSVWHLPCLQTQDLLMRIHGRWRPSTLLPESSNVGIDDTPFVNTWHGKPGNASQPQQSSAENGASGSIAGSPSRPYSLRNASACSCCVAAHRRTPCRFGVIADHLPPRPTNPPTQRSSVIPSGIVVCSYHNGGELDEMIALVVA